jgi:phosphatidylglycerol---prolipoprotein diacylglyceryl transferase
MIYNYIIWNPNEVLFQLGFFKVRWYSLLIICAFLCGRQLLKYFFKKEGRPVEDVDPLSLYILIACLVGARMGEVFFYNFSYYWRHPLEAIFPVEFSPHFHVVGYKGLSYHGALIGGVVGTLLYAYYQISFSLVPFRLKVKKHRKQGQSVLWLLTPLAFGVLMGFFVRIGNFFNSEILGTPTHNQHGVLFAKDITQGITNSSAAIKSVQILKDSTSQPEPLHAYPPIVVACTFAHTGVDEEQIKLFVENKLTNYLRNSHRINEQLYLPADAPLEYTLTKNKKGQYTANIKAFGIPRHPVQLYESFSYLLTLLALVAWWNWRGSQLRDGVIAGVATIVSYSFRFFFEFFKDPFNVVIPGTHPITMGHILSLLTVLGGMIILILAYRFSEKKSTALHNA